MPYQLTADLQRSNVTAEEIVTSLGDWSARDKDTLSFTHEVEGEYLEVRRKDGGRECLVPKVYGAWWNKLIFNLMMWGNTLQWCTALIYNDRPGNVPNFYRSSGIQRGSTRMKKFEKNKNGWITIALEWWKKAGNSLIWYMETRDALVEALQNDPEGPDAKRIMQEYAVRERWDIAEVRPGPAKYNKDVFDEADAASFGEFRLIIILLVIMRM